MDPCPFFTRDRHPHAPERCASGLALVCAGVLLGLTFTLAPAHAWQAEAAQKKAQGTALPEDTALQEIEDALRSKAAEEAQLKKEAEARAQEIRKLRYRLIETADSIQDSEREIARIERELVRLEAEEKEMAEKLAAEQSNLSAVLAALQAFEMSQPPALLVSPDDANRAARAALLLSEAAPALATRAEDLRGLVDQLTAARTALADQRVAYERTAISLASRRRFLADDLKVKEAERDVADRLAAAAQRETATLAARATSIKDVVARLRAVAHSITPRPKPPRVQPANALAIDGAGAPGAGDPAIDTTDEPDGIQIIAEGARDNASPGRRGSNQRGQAKRPTLRREDVATVFKPAISFVQARGALKMPVVGRITTKFGQRDKLGDRADGIRIAVRDQAIVTAPYEAKVVFAQPWELTGNMIVLDVGGGYHMLMLGVGRFLVDEGQIVKAGEPLAEMTGAQATLDVQVRRNGEPVNPAQWFSSKAVAEANF
ncbi:MAG: peptidoglycan DD-metalloendopeptidase family protein [Pseudomonadota bacterium]